MTTAEKQKKCYTVKTLREFIKDLPDNMPIRGDFTDDRIEAVVWVTDSKGIGPKRYLGLERVSE